MPALPVSLRAIHAFCEVIRCGGIAKAAESLGVTPSALSHQLNDLELRLGVSLFQRTGRGLVATDEGERLAASVVPAIGDIESAVLTLVRRRTELRVSTISTFAMRWLIPRLSRFQERHPEVELLVSTTTRAVDFQRESFDAAIRWGKGGWSDVEAVQLYSEELVPVSSPGLASATPLVDPADLSRVPLLHARARHEDWSVWLNAAGLTGIDPLTGPTFDSRNFAIQAAIGGLGAAVVDPRFVEAELAAGQLVQPFGPSVRLDTGYWLVWRPGRGERRPLADFRRWLVEEICATTPPPSDAAVVSGSGNGASFAGERER